MIAEDNRYDQLILRRVFKVAGLSARLRFVNNGEELLSYLGGIGGTEADGAVVPAPSIVLLDMNMPKVDGWEALREIRRNRNLQHLPVIALSTSEEPNYIARAYALGANSYLSKPSDFSDYVTKIKILGEFWFGAAHLPPKLVH